MYVHQLPSGSDSFPSPSWSEVCPWPGQKQQGWLAGAEWGGAVWPEGPGCRAAHSCSTAAPRVSCSAAEWFSQRCGVAAEPLALNWGFLSVLD